MVLNIGGKDYTFEFTFEASLHGECAKKVTMLMNGLRQVEVDENASPQERLEAEKQQITSLVESISDVPKTALVMFHAGLLENHSDEIKSESDAKELIKVYLRENAGTEDGNFYAVMEKMIEQMGNDDFFKLIGLENLFVKAEEESQAKVQKIPQDHKKKQTTKTTTRSGK